MKKLSEILAAISSGTLTPEEGEERIKKYFIRDAGHSNLDLRRAERTGYPEVIYCERKTVSQILEIVEVFHEAPGPLLLTRVTPEQGDAVCRRFPEGVWNELGRTVAFHPENIKNTERYIGIVTAGTSDLPVAEEAAVTAEIFGNRVERINDVGVAGIHRLFGKIDTIRNARVVVVAAGMEGALPSVVAGLVDKPVIAVPTSVGYGASFGGLAALLGMLNSCSPGISVVNIDNGFGAGYLAGMINSM
jgi:pyridinium-3,5-biscarboxylic acid mononucleotide synthase